jgi:hypothetical protein
MTRPSRAFPMQCTRCHKACCRREVWRELCRACALIGVTTMLTDYMVKEHLRGSAAPTPIERKRRLGVGGAIPPRAVNSPALGASTADGSPAHVSKEWPHNRRVK